MFGVYIAGFIFEFFGNAVVVCYLRFQAYDIHLSVRRRVLDIVGIDVVGSVLVVVDGLYGAYGVGVYTVYFVDFVL